MKDIFLMKRVLLYILEITYKFFSTNLIISGLL